MSHRGVGVAFVGAGKALSAVFSHVLRRVSQPTSQSVSL